ncbi:MAG: hypothetical protein LBE36_09430 [Flavobacteriaceae bacterium]|jgi:hypothetical protein|nr:hypothetical protein [Flavobacteriaceae bacterium]
MKINLFAKISFAVLLAFVVSIFTYIAFGNIYSYPLLNYENFKEQYTSGVYQYRFLGISIFIWVYELLENSRYEIILKTYFWDDVAEKNMLLAYYFVNTFFLILSAVVMVLILETKLFIIENSEKLLLIAVSVFTICLSQFVLVPYDCLSYFWTFLFFLVFIKYLENFSTQNLVLLLLILSFSTMTRESSALEISLAATLLFPKYKFGKKTIISIGWMIFIFLFVYTGLRLIYGSFTIINFSRFTENFTYTRNILGIGFWVVFFMFGILTAKDKTASKNIIIFHILSLPYIVFCVYTGNLYEIRLYVPIFLISLFLAKISHFQKSLI